MGEEQKIKCPVCGERFDLDPDLEAGDTTYCPGCYVDLKILKVNPPRVEEVRDMDDAEDIDREEVSDEGDY